MQLESMEQSEDEVVVPHACLQEKPAWAFLMQDRR